MIGVINGRFHTAPSVDFQSKGDGSRGEGNGRFHQTLSWLQRGNGDVVAVAIMPQEEAVFGKDAVVAGDGVTAGAGLEPGLVAVGGGDGFLDKVTVLQAAAHDPGSRDAVKMMGGGGKNCRVKNTRFPESGGIQHIKFAGLFAAHIEQEQLPAPWRIDDQRVLKSRKLVARIPVKQNHFIQDAAQSKPHQPVLVLGEDDGEKTAVWQRMNRVDKTIGSGENASWLGGRLGNGLGSWFSRAEGA